MVYWHATEIFPLVKEARALGVTVDIVVTHAEFPSQNLTDEEQSHWLIWRGYSVLLH